MKDFRCKRVIRADYHDNGGAAELQMVDEGALLRKAAQAIQELVRERDDLDRRATEYALGMNAQAQEVSKLKAENERLVRERDEAMTDNEKLRAHGINVLMPLTARLERSTKEALARAEAAEAKLEEAKRALEEIASKGPKEEPPPAFDEYGYASAGNVDDIASDFVDVAMWEVAQIARTTLSRIQKEDGR